ncbi:MAG: Ig-like domain repeat protein [Coriobacteriales bacterium]|jgi:hypothetical protein|nr:Ig-like domain repeat protein [Coriobacteriales bacterium]
MPLAALQALAAGIGTLATGQPAAAPQFTHNPADSVYSEAASGRFYVRASSIDGGYLSYQWYRSQAYDAPQNKTQNADAIKATGTAFTADNPDPILKADGTKSTLDFTTPTVEATTYYYYWTTVTNHVDSNGNDTTTDPGETNYLDSGIAEVKVVNKTLSPSLVLGDFESFANIGVGVRPIVDYWPSSTYPFAWNSTVNENHGGNRSNNNGIGKVFDINPHGTWRTGLEDGKHGTYSIEIAPFYAASAYQEIATVPGKIYEWSFDHACRYSAKSPDVMALIIGPAVNDKNEYGKYVSNEPDYWNTLKASTTPTQFTPPYPADGDYPYGINNHSNAAGINSNNDTYFLAILNQMMKDYGLKTSQLPSVANNSEGFATTYYGKNYYVYIASTIFSEAWKTKSGAYTVPAGQGTTVYGWLDISQHDGNIVDNIVFAPGTGIAPEQEASYSGESSLSAQTKAGYAYALAEVRGSSVTDLTSPSATYNPAPSSGGTASPISPTPNLGSGSYWYTKDANGTGFATGGELTFHNLTPGKTYRVIGIPLLAINSGLHTNESPGAVLDNSFYADIKLLPASGGSEGGSGEASVPAYEMEVYGQGVNKHVRLSLLNTNTGVEYALLADDGTGKPDTTAPALPATDWTTGTGSGTRLVFEGLLLNTTYYLVARPSGWTEVDYASAAYDAAGTLSALTIHTPSQDDVDVDAAYLTRESNGTAITIAGDGTRDGYTYAAVNVSTGAIEASSAYTGNTLTLSNLVSSATYQVVCRPAGKSWMYGVRVYPYPQTVLGRDYATSEIGAGSDGAQVIPAGIQYRVRAADNNNTWLVGSDTGDSTDWAQFLGTERLDLSDASVVAAGKLAPESPAMSIFAALDTLQVTGPTAASLLYRIGQDANYSGPAVRPASALSIDARPSAPTSESWTFDYVAETVTFSAARALEWSYIGQDTWTPAGGTALSFASLGWTGASALTTDVRYCYVENTSFASALTKLVLPARTDAPIGIKARLDDPTSPQHITLYNLDVGTVYQYRAGEGATWMTFTAEIDSEHPDEDGAITLSFTAASPDYDIRFAAVTTGPDAKPASLFATVSSPLNVSAVNFGTYTYGQTVPAHPISINNIMSDDIEIGANALTIEASTASGHESDVNYFTLNTPGSKTVPGNSSDTAWTITPTSPINAGSYQVRLHLYYTITTDDVEKGYDTYANVYLVVDKATWDIEAVSAVVPPESISATGFSVNVSGMPVGSSLLYRLSNSGAWTPGTSSLVLSGLEPESTYPVYVRAALDNNHNQSPAKLVATVSTAFGQPDTAQILSINYTTETLSFAPGVTPSAYEVRVGGTLASLPYSLSGAVTAGSVAVVLQHKTDGTHPASDPSTPLVLPQRPDAPTGVSTQRASSDTSTDGQILYSGIFQYRASKNGADITQDWEQATDVASVTAGRYEVRLSPTDATFGSQISPVTVASATPQVTVQTKTAGTGDAEARIEPTFVSLPSGWIRSTDLAEPGEFNHSYTSSPLTLPSVVTSTSHVFLGWYKDIDFEEGPVTQTDEVNNPPALPEEYFAKWAVRPTVASVTTAGKQATLVPDATSATKGLLPSDPVVLGVRLATEASASDSGAVLALNNITLEGQSGTAGKEAKLFSDADFTSEIVGSATIAWGAAPTRLYLRTTSADDASTEVYYALDVYATRVVSFEATQEGGAGPGSDTTDLKTTTGIKIVFGDGSGGDADVSCLTAENITLISADATGHATKGALTHVSNSTYSLEVSDVLSGQVRVIIPAWAGYVVENTTTPMPGEPEISRVITVYQDKTPPTAQVKYNSRPLLDFLNDLTFGLFFTETVKATITPYDTGGDGVDKTYYLKSAEVISPDDLPGASWTEGTTFEQAENDTFFLYTKVTDKAGNATYYEDGIVIYTNSEQDTAEITFAKASGEDVTATVKLNGNGISTIKIDNTELTKGYEYTLDESGATVTFLATYLDTLEADDYTLTFSYDPRGKTYVDDDRGVQDANLNAAPSTTTVTLHVVKSDVTVSLVATPASPITYGATTTLTATVAGEEVAQDAAHPTGTVTFYKQTDASTAVALGTPQQLSDGVASVDVVLDAAEYSFVDDPDNPGQSGYFPYIYAAYTPAGADENYNAGSGILDSYTVNKATQTGLSILNADESDADITGTTLELAREVRSLDVSATGGQSPEGYSWQSSVPDVATIAPDADPALASITFVAPGTTTITLTKPESTNYSEASVSFTLTVKQETTPPDPGADGAITIAPETITDTTVTLTWQAAEDNFTDADDLIYKVYAHQIGTDDMITPEDCEEHGTLVGIRAGTDAVEGTFTFTVGAGGIDTGTGTDNSALVPDKHYWFNVVVIDEAKNAAAYEAKPAMTPITVSATALQQGGASGTAITTDILVTFSAPVLAFSKALTSFVLPDGVDIRSSSTPVAGTDNTQWLIHVTLDGTVANGATLNLTLQNWTYRENVDITHSYKIASDSTSLPVTFYKTVRYETPSAQINYVTRYITGLTPGATYSFSGGDKVVASSDGTWQIPGDWYGTTVSIVRHATSGDEYIDSLPQELNVPVRPVQPTLNVVQPTAQSSDGTVTLTNYNSEYTYESRKATAISPLVWGAWADVTVSSSETSLSFEPGTYQIRVKVVEGSRFTSVPTDFFIHNYESVIFNDKLQGYDVSSDTDLTRVVNTDASGTVSDVEWDMSTDDFMLIPPSEAQTSWTVQPASGLDPGTYTAKLKISYDNGIPDETQDVSFTVHPYATFAEPVDTAGAVLSDSDGDGVSDRLTLTFVYPIVGTLDAPGLRFDEVVLYGAVEKTPGSTDFINDPENDDYKVYELAITPHMSAKTNDTTQVKIRSDKNGKEDIYWFQLSQMSNDPNLYAYPKVEVARKIESAKAVTILNGYSTSYIQFTLAEPVADGLDYHAIVAGPAVASDSLTDPHNLSAWQSGIQYLPDGGVPYPGPVKITDASGDPVDGLDIIQVAYADADAYYYPSEGADKKKYALTWRALFILDEDFVEPDGGVFLSIDNFAPEKIEVDGTIVKSEETFTDAIYFLGPLGYNYLTDIDGYQTLPGISGEAYKAAALSLRTSVDMGDDPATLPDAIVKEVRIKRPGESTFFVLDADAYSTTWDANQVFHFTDAPPGEPPTELKNQLIVVLNEDWTRINGTYTIAVVFEHDPSGTPYLSEAQGTFSVSDIIPTYKVELSADTTPDVQAPTPFGEYGINGSGATANVGYYEASRAVTLTAATAPSGYKFWSWEQTAGVDVGTIATTSPATITMPATPGDTPIAIQAHYVESTAPVTTIDPTGGWVNASGTITLNATDGSASPTTYYTLDGGVQQTYSAPFALSGQDGSHTITYWSVDIYNNTEAQHTATIGLDTTSPELELTIRSTSYDSFSSPDSGYTHFYKGIAPTLAIRATDNGSGLASANGLEYLIYTDTGTGPLFADEAAALEDTTQTWVAITEGSPLNAALPSTGKYYVYVRARDAVENAHAIASEGIVFYADSSLDATAGYTRFGGTAVTVAYTDNQNTISQLVCVPAPSGAIDTSYTLALGTDYNTTPGTPGTPGTLTLTSAFLERLTPSETPYILTMTVNPQGVSYTAGTTGNDAPQSPALALTVNKATSTLALTAAPPAGSDYGDEVTLTATVTGVAGKAVPQGTVEFFDGEASLGDPVNVDSNGTALLKTSILSVGPHSLSAVYSGDGNYLDDEGALLPAYSVSKAAQSALHISLNGTDYTGDTLPDVIYGTSFALSASGEAESTSDYVWTYNTAVLSAQTSAGNATCTFSPITTGEVNIYLAKAGDANYNAATEVSVHVVILPKPVSIAYIPNELLPDTRVYDATADVALVGTNKVLNGHFEVVGVKDDAEWSDKNSVGVDISAASASFTDGPDVVLDASGTAQPKPVEFFGIKLNGGKANCYKLSDTPFPTNVSALVTKATPLWATGSPQASSIHFGEYVEASLLGGTQVLGAGGVDITSAGTLAWDANVNQTIPGNEDAELALSYSYTVEFTPVDDPANPYYAVAKNYTTLSGTAAIVVLKALPRMAGTTVEYTEYPQGSTLFSNPPGQDTLSTSEITGDVVYTLGDTPEALEGVWLWAPDEDPNEAFATEGVYQRNAQFIPGDKRVDTFITPAFFSVWSPKTEVDTKPSLSTGVYGGEVSEVEFLDNGCVIAEPTDKSSATDITDKGSWSWKDPDQILTSKTGIQTATAVFTPYPEYIVDFSVSPPTGLYVPLEIELAIDITPAVITVTSYPLHTATLAFGDAVTKDPDALLQGPDNYVFEGVTDLDGMSLYGNLDWDFGVGVDPAHVVPGAQDYETSTDETGKVWSVFDDGVFYAPALFTPDASYDNAYVPLPLLVKFVVTATEKATEELENDISSKRPVLQRVNIAPENYDAVALSRFEAAFEAARKALALGAPPLSQGVAESLLAELDASTLALVSDHPLQENSAEGGIYTTGIGVLIRVKGEYTTISRVELNGQDFSLSALSGTNPREMVYQDKDAGTLAKGSALIVLTPEFVDTLGNDTHELVVHFDDGYSVGQGAAVFTINRPHGTGPAAGGSSTTDASAIETVASVDKATQTTPEVTTSAPSEDINGVGTLNPLLIAVVILLAAGLIAATVAVVTIRRKKARGL